jgi:two-component system phosphate regulon sensor histidine kinase PhoR
MSWKAAEHLMPRAIRRVWIADDSPLDADRARRALGDGYAIEIFDDGSGVLERLASHDDTPDLLVIDWLMPGVSGLEVCRFLRASAPPLSSLPVLLVTVHQRTEQVVEGLEAGANDFVSKPFAEAELRARVDALVRVQVLLEQLEQSEAMVRHLLANSPDALLALDARGAVLFANIEAERLFGRSAEALRGALLRNLLPPLSSWRTEESVQAWNDVQLGGRLFAPSLRRAKRGREEQWILTLRDVTLEREREARRLDFYSIVAHELRSPLSAALLRTELMLGADPAPPPALSDEIRKLQRNLGSLVGTINDFLDLARSETSASQPRDDRVRIADLIEETTEEYSPVAQAHALELDTTATARDLVVSGDKRRLKQVVSNLVGNALKFTPAGGKVQVVVEQVGGSACVSVHDTGRGIAPDALPKVFDRYSRAIDDEHEVVGSGLGLMIVKQTVEAHGGRLGVRSEEGAGSTFWFTLPLASAA